jgi:N-acetylglucosaminyldiphosphoundecaprenol N-acetyl-beta-D-mannosaminyltransferase
VTTSPELDGESFRLLHGIKPAVVDVLGVPVSVVDRPTLTRILGSLPNGQRQGWLSYVNINAVNLAQEIPWFKDFLRQSLLTYCDGEGVRLGSRIIGTPLPERIVLTEWIYDVCLVAEEQHWKIFLLGSTSSVLERTLPVLQSKYPTLNVVGSHHGYFSPRENDTVVTMINKTHPDLLIVAMGMPKQERWILDNIHALNVPLMMNAGSCFDYVSGVRPRCPGWMGHVGLEWLYRLVQEPRRLWKRYLLGNPLFLLRVIRARMRESED